MERVTAGEEILVRRRGKPIVRLTAVTPQLLAPYPAPGELTRAFAA
jgi:antitoxin (DNA-binding transcriptional repressor) of toxin-antitoxin stability system